MFCEELESRELFSFSATMSIVALQLQFESSATRISLAGLRSDTQQQIKSITKELKSLPVSQSNATLLTKLKADISATQSTLQTDTRAVFSAGKLAFQKYKNAFAILKRQPTNTAAQAQLSVALSQLPHSTSDQEQTLTTRASSGNQTISADLDAIAAANSSDTTLITDLNLLRQSFTGFSNSSLQSAFSHAAAIGTELSAFAVSAGLIVN